MSFPQAYLKESAADVWYVCSPRQRRDFEQFCLKQLSNIEYMNHHEWGRRQVLLQKANFFVPLFSKSMAVLHSSNELSNSNGALYQWCHEHIMAGLHSGNQIAAVVDHDASSCFRRGKSM